MIINRQLALISTKITAIKTPDMTPNHKYQTKLTDQFEMINLSINCEYSSNLYFFNKLIYNPHKKLINLFI